MARTFTREERYRVLQSPEEIRPLHDRISQSAFRQTYHIQPVTGLLNDPNGFCFHDGLWHLFYQWCPWGAVHGLKYWYHVTSRDLVKWENQGVCIRPDTEWDNKGAYSGSALTGKDSLYLYYTGNHRDADWKRTAYTCLVRLGDDGSAKKLDHPLFGPNPDYTEHQRDPKIIHNTDTGKYYLLLGAQTKDLHGCILVYESDSPFDGWKFRGQLRVPGFESFGNMWECPAVEHFNGMDILLFCAQHLTLPGRGGVQNHNGYLIGHMDYEKLQFTPTGRFHVLDRGFDAYAAACGATIHHDKNKAVLIAWMGLPDSSYPPTDDEDWASCLTLPRELRMRGRRLIQTPLPELNSLRGDEVDPEGRKLPLACNMEVHCYSTDLELRLFTRGGGEGGFVIRYDAGEKKISVDRTGMLERFNQSDGEVRERLLENGLQLLRIYVDHSSVEIFVNDGDAVFSSRVFPHEEEHGFTIRGGGTAKIWTMNPAVKDDFII
ncbi:MAG: glycoside hydrolase family 32 protein [Lachnospiraceae bacterium]